MFETIKQLLCKFLKIPPEPRDPFGEPGSVRVFRASRKYYHYKLLAWGVSSVASLLGAIFLCVMIGVLMSVGNKDVSKIAGELAIISILAVGGALFKSAAAFFIVRLDYEMRWYKLSDRSLRIREGVFTVKEMTMTFANIQNIGVSQGPIQRLFSIYDLKVDSAGGGGGVVKTGSTEPQDSSAPHIACFRGIDNPDEIMGLMRERMKHAQDTGLGHPDEEETPSQSKAESLRLALAEAKALRLALESAAA